MPKAKVVVLIGAQGSGKSTLLNHFISKGFVGITMSDLLKEKARVDENFSKKYKINSTIHEGALISDEGVEEAFLWKLGSYDIPQTNFVLDGCTRTIFQLAMVTDKFLYTHEIIFFHVECPTDVCLERIKNRVKIDIEKGIKPRTDDTNEKGEFDPEKVGKRIRLFLKNITGIIEVIMALEHRYFPIDGEMPVEIVVAEAESFCSK